MKVLSIDFGSKNIGLAVSDATGLIAQAIGTLRRKNLRNDVKQLAKKAAEYEAEKVVVGLPKNMNGSSGQAAIQVLEFVELLKKQIPLPVVTWDERLSTAEAERFLIHADVSRSKRKKVIDKVAAAIILQGYLDFCNRE